jgi:hypothetical protein
MFFFLSASPHAVWLSSVIRGSDIQIKRPKGNRKLRQGAEHRFGVLIGARGASETRFYQGRNRHKSAFKQSFQCNEFALVNPCNWTGIPCYALDGN